MSCNFALSWQIELNQSIAQAYNLFDDRQMSWMGEIRLQGEFVYEDGGTVV
ncbi:hypothetical protein KDI_50060 [Dictyobacter arantiisoli]|uniref:Uncharacterized protein n=1 Tax=Dictyobacter arantiisoli TaxID=2014874 RepID=A0A5A5TJC3_9CHLR|nr:hypothetical protein [Dictyobacter arantiisoli]GCF11442.1 hypothetical protein KDI_50060 [Dictyobacter arantiisoli]